MRKLTNRQMDVLSERVTDLLEAAHVEKHKALVNSDEYKNFSVNYKDEIVERLEVLGQQIYDIEDKIVELDKQKQAIKQEVAKIHQAIHNLSTPVQTWNVPSINDIKRNYVSNMKSKRFAEIEFDRDKVLRRVQADILLSDVENPEELVRELVNKLKTNE